MCLQCNIRDRRSGVKRSPVCNIAGVETFQRARSEEQRQRRRQQILDATVVMLEEMSVGAVSLNELSRRVGLAKSNVLRYFESREAILLELLDQAWKQWLADIGSVLADQQSAEATALQRAEHFAGVVADSLIERPVLCDLMSAQIGVLEHNVSPDVAARYKRAALNNIGDLAMLARASIPELGDAAHPLCVRMIMLIGAVWTASYPSAATVAACQADPSLGAQCMDFGPDLREILTVLAAGTLVTQG